MGKVNVNISMSLDGYVGGPDQREGSTRDRRRAASRVGGFAQGIPREPLKARGTEGIENVIEARTGEVLVVDASAPGVGWA